MNWKWNKYKCKVCGKTDPAEFYISKHNICKEHYYEYQQSLKKKKDEKIPEPTMPTDTDDETPLEVVADTTKEVVFILQEQINTANKEIAELKATVKEMQEKLRTLAFVPIKPTPTLPPITLPPPLPVSNTLPLPVSNTLPLPSRSPRRSSPRRSRSPPTPTTLPLPEIETKKTTVQEDIAQHIANIEKGWYSIIRLNEVLAGYYIKTTIPKSTKKETANKQAIALLKKLLKTDE